MVVHLRTFSATSLLPVSISIRNVRVPFVTCRSACLLFPRWSRA